MPSLDMPDVHRIEQALKVVMKGMEVILLVDLNVSMRKTQDER